MRSKTGLAQGELLARSMKKSKVKKIKQSDYECKADSQKGNSPDCKIRLIIFKSYKLTQFLK